MIIKEFFDELNRIRIVYSVLRGYEELPYDFSNDIDLYVKPEHLDSVIEIFERVTTQTNSSIVDFNSKFEFLSVTVVEKDRVIKFDIWTGFKYRGFEYLSNDVVEENIEEFNGISVLNKNAECLLTTSKEILHTGTLVKRKKNKLIAKVGNSWTPGSHLKTQGLHEYTEIILYENDYKKIRNLRILGFAKIIRRNISAYGLLTLLSCLNFLKYHFKSKKTISQIAFVGPDGSGKTTFYHELKNTLLGLKNVKSINYYHGRPNIIPELKKFNIFKVNRKIPDPKECNSQYVSKAGHLKERTLRKVYILYYFFDYMLFIPIALKNVFTNSTSIFDRYYYDYFIAVPKLNDFDKVLFAAYRYFVPNPSLVVFLYSPAQTIFERKPELSLDEISSQQSRIKVLSDEACFKKLVTIETFDDSTSARISRKNKIMIALIGLSL